MLYNEFCNDCTVSIEKKRIHIFIDSGKVLRLHVYVAMSEPPKYLDGDNSHQNHVTANTDDGWQVYRHDSASSYRE